MASKTFLGQHFLNDGAVMQKIITALDIQRGNAIIEIGPGHGELTKPLLEKCSALEGKIIVIEKDVALADELAHSDIGKNIEVVTGDILKILGTLKPVLENKKYRLTGNIPYYITGHLLRIVSALENKPERCVLMVQKEVAERIIEEPPKMNRLAASVQFWAAPKIIGSVPKHDFVPPPKVDSSILFLETVAPSASVAADRYYAAVRSLFSQPRKTILNNLTAHAAHETKERVSAALAELGVAPGSRPQNLTVANIASIAEALFVDNLMA
jgi:16S rRNA (adenine1518-N6/adenine1519-N6)-dimethyltransferase